MRTVDAVCNQQISQSFITEYLLQPVRQRLEALVQLLGPASLIGFDGSTMDSAINEALQASRCREALQLLTADWEEEGIMKTPDEPEHLLHEEWPSDIRQLESEQELGEQDQVCFGHENAGNTCFLQACLVLLCLHERELLPPKHENESELLSDLRHLLKKSRRQRVPREDVWSVAQKLERAGIMCSGQQDDAVEILEKLLDECKSLKLALPIMTCARQADCLGMSETSSRVYVSSDLNEWVLRTALGANKTFATLVQEIVMESVADCKVEIGEEGKMTEVELPMAVRARRRLPGQLPPSILPICFGRWDAASRQKRDDSLSVPMEDLIVPLLPPTQETLTLSHMESWCYELVSFIVHMGSLENGHYIAYFKSTAGWQAVDNDQCHCLAVEDARRQASKAYLLVYRRDASLLRTPVCSTFLSIPGLNKLAHNSYCRINTMCESPGQPDDKQPIVLSHLP